MEKDFLSLIELLDYFESIIDPDGVCENGCDCGECDTCIEFGDALSDFHTIKDQYKYLMEEYTIDGYRVN